MKKIILLICLISAINVQAQITIVKADMPVAGDTIRFSNASIQTVVDLTLTGTSYLWNFANLIPVSQGVDTFLTVSSTPFIYSLFYNQFGSNPANLAQKGQDITGVTQLQITNVFNFYNKTNSQYEQVGIGASLNGITTPVAFSSHDIIYRFPMNFGNADSSDSNMSLTIPALGTYAQQTHRVNHVDGWGSLVTPYGTHNVLRVVTDLTGSDSLYVDTLGFGFSQQRPLTREYKWWANGMEIPLLQINTTVLGTNETITTIIYRDNYVVNVGLNQLYGETNQPTIYPNPSSGNTTVHFNSTSIVPVTLQLLDVSGKLISEEINPVVVGENSLFIAAKVTQGTYFLKIQQGDSINVLRWLVH